jgi:phospholipid/cholesterol/gamma-HCH transport system permease protein
VATLFSLLAALGGGVLGFLREIGFVAMFAMKGTVAIFQPPWFFRETLRQLLRIGYFSLPVVGLTALFTGAALALQIYVGGSRFNAESTVPAIVALGFARELGPVLAGLIVAGRVSAAIAAEIGTMRVTEQIDALITLSTDPMRYLVAPRLLAATLTLPILVAVGDSIGILGGYYIGVERLGFNGTVYLDNTAEFLEVSDVISGLWKAAVFGYIIALMGSFHGYNSGRGAQGVGRAATQAVVSASVLILAANYVLTELFFSN